MKPPKLTLKQIQELPIETLPGYDDFESEMNDYGD